MVRSATACFAFLWVSVLGLGGCSTSEPSGSRSLSGLGPYSVTPELELEIGQLQGLVAWHRDVVVICPFAEIASSRENCEVHALDADGGLSRTGIQGARSARRVQQGILVERPNLDLVLVKPDRSEKTIASQAALPGVSSDGRSVAYVQRVADDTQIVFHDLITDQRRVVTTDPSASAPYVVPGSADVLFVSARTGLASYFIGTADGQERQLTNLGMTQVGKGFVPVAMNQLVWIPDTQTAVFTAHYASDEIWLFDVSGKSLPSARRLGPGTLPNLKTGGGIVAFDQGPPHVERAPRVASYLEAR